MNRFNNYEPTPYVSSYLPLPLDAIMKAGAMKQQEQDRVSQEKEMFLDKQINANKQDVDYIRHEKKKLDAELNNYWGNKDFNDPSIRQEWNRRKRELANLYGPQGAFGVIESNYQSRNQYIKDLKSKLDKKPEDGGIDKDQFDKLISISDNEYKGIGTNVDEYNSYNGIIPASNPNITKQALDLAEGWKANAVERGQVTWSKDGKYLIKTDGSNEVVSDEEIYRNILPELKRNPANASYVKQQIGLNTYGQDRFITGSGSNQVEWNPDAYKEGLYNSFFENPARLAANKYGYSKTKYTEDVSADAYALKDYEHKKDLELAHFESTYGQQGEQTVNNLMGVYDAEPSNSIISKILNFVSPASQAQGLINMYKVIDPVNSKATLVTNLEKELSNKSELSEDKINEKVEKIGFEMKQKMAKDQKSFRETFGFGSPIIDQSYSMVDMFTKGKHTESNVDYERAKAVTKTLVPNFDNLTNKEQYRVVKEQMGKAIQTSRTDVILVPTSQKELDFKNEQLAQFTGNPKELESNLTTLGLSANGRFIDYYTGKETKLEDISSEGQLKYMGQLENDNKFGPGINYFQSANGKFYVSPGSLEDQKKNYLDWNLKQFENKFSKEFEFPIDFEQRRTGIDINNKVKEGIPKIKITQDLKSGRLSASMKYRNKNYHITGDNIDEIKSGLAELTKEIQE